MGRTDQHAVGAHAQAFFLDAALQAAECAGRKRAQTIDKLVQGCLSKSIGALEQMRPGQGLFKSRRILPARPAKMWNDLVERKDAPNALTLGPSPGGRGR